MALLLLPVLAPLTARAADPVAPDSGSILQQIRPAQAPAPSSGVTGLSIQQDGSSSLPPSTPFVVNAIEISGNTSFDSDILHRLVADVEGDTLTLPQLGEVSDRITKYYRNRGYPLARAIIPAQVIDAGRVRFEVVEARYGTISIDNNTRVGAALPKATLAPLESGEVIAESELNRSLLLLSDIPGMVVGATLSPGELVGTSDLSVTATAAPTVWGNLTVDSNGNRYTGRTVAGGTVHFGNPLRRGDVLTASASSAGSGFNYARLAYDTPVNGLGTHVGGSYAALRYEIGDSLKALDADGTAQVASLWTRHALVRSRDFNLYLQAQYDHMQLSDHVDAVALRTDRDLSSGTLGLSGDAIDAIWGGGVNTWSVAWTSGDVDFKDLAAESADALTADTRGGYSKWNANFSRLQNLNAKTQVYAGVAGQWARDNLDSSQKMNAGGAASVRAYDVGTVSGDSGVRASLELRHELGLAWQGQWQALVFMDTARIRVNENPWSQGDNHTALSGAGVGLNWFGRGGSSMRAFVAAPIGAEPESSGSSKSSRAWVEFAKRF
jgi:hemolysin activation/secretion protein